MMLLAVLAWCAVSVLVGGFWCLVCAGSTRGAAPRTDVRPRVDLPSPRASLDAGQLTRT